MQARLLNSQIPVRANVTGPATATNIAKLELAGACSAGRDGGKKSTSLHETRWE
jgi:hypothetical protein